MNINMELLTLSFLAGILTVLAPCVLPVLPVILGGSLRGETNFWRPLVITLSLVFSIIIFTLLLKASTLLINIDQDAWKVVSGSIILFFGFITVFPIIWDKLSFRFGFERKSQTTLNEAAKKQGLIGNIFLGAALGPVFASCSPTYFFIIATVLPTSFFTGLLNLVAYGAGLGIILLLIAFSGQAFIRKAKWAADPHGFFKRGLGVLLIVVGIGIISGIDKKVEIYLLDKGFGSIPIEQALLEDYAQRETSENTDESKQAVDKSVGIENDDFSSLPFLGKAPELAGLSNWMNSEPINSIAELRGKVVLIDFWTYSCVNCIRTLPYIQSWHEKYAADGLVIIGVHAPEFQFEQKPENVAKAITDFELSYPVALDNTFSTWKAFKNIYWPAKYLIDREGNLRYTHFGEGEYDETEKAIVGLLGTEEKSGHVVSEIGSAYVATPETYLGTKRRNPLQYLDDASKNLGLNQWKLAGNWQSTDEKIETTDFPAAIFLNFTAAEANLVIGGNAVAEIYIDGNKLDTSSGGGADIIDGLLRVNAERLYNLTDFKNVSGNHTIEVRFLSGENAELYAWTFG